MRGVLAIVLAALALPAWAADGVSPNVFAARLFGKAPGPGMTHVCLNRDYDAAHLAQHPQQKVASMMIALSDVPESAKAAHNIAFSIGVRLRGSAGPFTSGGNCSLINSTGLDNGLVDMLQCSVDCDGGGITFRLPVDATHVFTELEKGQQLALAKGNDAEHGITLVRGTDDRVFKLERIHPHACLPIVQDDDIKQAIRASK